jgi:hypothetical protein
VSSPHAANRHAGAGDHPGDYAYQQGYNCHIYEKTARVDGVIALASTALTLSGLLLAADRRELGRPLAIGAGVVTAPFVVAAIAGQLGRSRCARWGHEAALRW